MNPVSDTSRSASDRDPWLSVIVPIYNGARYLGDCVHSVLEQSFPDFELILVDDGSSDQTPELCRAFERADERVVVIRKENGGSYQTRLLGAEHARGAWVTFLDSDDSYLHKDVFRFLHETTERYDCDALQFEFVKRYRHLRRASGFTDAPLLLTRERFLAEEYPVLIADRWDGSHLTPNVWNKLYRRELLSDLIPSREAERLFMGEDLVMNLQLLEGCRAFLFLPDRLYAYRMISGGTRKFSRNTMRDLDLASAYQLRYLERWNGVDKAKPEYRIIANMAGWFFGYAKEAARQLPEEELRTL